tara:strand:- start:269 stop:598 length:330 start_codon:yes stop_codon:yes gene_type:complete
MNIKNFIFILFASYFATLIRLYIDNNFLISIIGSFFFGFIIARKLSQSMNMILLTGFCSCFTSFTGFIYFLYELINQENFITIFFYLNIIIIFNLLMMYFGFHISRKIT